MRGKIVGLALGLTIVESVRVQRAYSGTVDPNTGQVPNREDAKALFALQCRDLVTAIDELPEDQQPVGWQINVPDVTA